MTSSITACFLPEIGVTSIRTTESCVENKRVLLEVIVNVTNTSLSGESGCSPSGSVWVCARHIIRLSPCIEAPHLDEVAGPFHSLSVRISQLACLLGDIYSRIIL